MTHLQQDRDGVAAADGVGIPMHVLPEGLGVTLRRGAAKREGNVAKRGKQAELMSFAVPPT
jgi:hypothetical protein